MVPCPQMSLWLVLEVTVMHEAVQVGPGRLCFGLRACALDSTAAFFSNVFVHFKFTTCKWEPFMSTREIFGETAKVKYDWSVQETCRL